MSDLRWEILVEQLGQVQEQQWTDSNLEIQANQLGQLSQEPM